MGMLDDFEFSFETARRITPEEVAAAKLAVKEQFGIEPREPDRNIDRTTASASQHADRYSS
jgi:hypothetical protein